MNFISIVKTYFTIFTFTCVFSFIYIFMNAYMSPGFNTLISLNMFGEVFIEKIMIILYLISGFILTMNNFLKNHMNEKVIVKKSFYEAQINQYGS